MRILLATVVLAAAGITMITAGTTAAASVRAQQNSSSNWSGYAVHGASYHRVVGSWTQPGVSCARGQRSYSAFWIGLGGYSGNALEQIGTEADCGTSGRPTLSAWYELVPAVSQPIPLAVSAGDAIDADVAVSGHRVTLSLTDRTRGRRFQIALNAPEIDVSSAEWIVEAPSACASSCTTLPLANFGTAVFSGARAQATSGRWGAISAPTWTTTQITLAPPVPYHSPARLSGAASPSGLSAAGSSFAVSYSPLMFPDMYAAVHGVMRPGHVVRPRHPRSARAHAGHRRPASRRHAAVHR